jgi:PAS domain S-box-containing protein
MFFLKDTLLYYPIHIIYSKVNKLTMMNKRDKMKTIKKTDNTEGKFKSLFENAQVAIFRSKLDGSAMLAANAKLAELFETTIEDLVKNPALIRWADPEKRKEMLTIVKQKGSVTDFEIDIITEKGNRRTALASIKIFPNEGYLEGSTIDITDRKRAETALHRAKDELTLRNDIANIFLTVSDDAMFDQVLQFLLRKFSSKYGVFGYIDEKGALVVPTMTRHVWDACNIPQKDVVFPKDSWGDSSWPTALREKKVVFSNEPSAKTPQGHVKILRHISMPIIHHGEAIGLLQLANKATDYVPEDIRLLETISVAIAPVLDARLHRDRSEAAKNIATESLRTNELKFRDTLKNLDEGYYSCSIDGTVLEHNIAFNRILGIAPQKEMKGAKLPDFWQNPPDRKAYLEALFAKGEIKNYLIKAKRLDGQNIDIIASSHLKKDDAEKPIGIDGIFIDVTELKRTEEALLLKNYVFDASVAANSVADTNGIITEVNDSFFHLWGYPTKEKALGKPLLDFINDPAEADAIVSALNTIGRWEGDYTAKRMDGALFMAHGLATALRDGSGNLVGYQSAVLDVTQQRKNERELAMHREKLESLVAQRTSELRDSEKKFKNLIDFTYGWEYWISPARHLIYVSPACERITGHAPDEFYKDPTLINRIIFPEDSASFNKHDDDFHIGEKKNESIEIEFRIIAQDASIRWIAHACRPITGDDGAFLGRRVSNRDITERKQMDEILKQKALQLQLANKELEAFAYSVSHDLRAPLRTIDGFSQALLEDYSDKIDDNGKDYLGRVRAATQRMAQLIDDLLKLSRVSRADMKIEPVDLGTIARSIDRDLRKVSPERDIEFVVGEGITVMGDPHLLRVVVENLMSNAWKFTGKHDRSRIELGSLVKDGEKTFFLKDDGAGFDPIYYNKLFVPFQRLHSMEEFPGTGVGLATIQRIIARHGGRVWAEGAVEKGATFYFTIKTEQEMEVGGK